MGKAATATHTGAAGQGAGITHGAPLTLSLPEQIAARLSERITAELYAPGRRVMEQEVSAEFGVSRGPVREALRLLEKEGLVTILPRRGAQVTRLSIAEVREIFDIRAALNGLRDRQIAEDAHRGELLPALESAVERLARLARNPGDADDYVEAVFELNRLLNDSTPNRRLRAILSSLALQTLRYSRLGLSAPERRLQSIGNWQRLVKSVKEGDGQEAQRAAEQRVLDSRDAAIAELEKREKPKSGIRD